MAKLSLTITENDELSTSQDPNVLLRAVTDATISIFEATVSNNETVAKSEYAVDIVLEKTGPYKDVIKQFEHLKDFHFVDRNDGTLWINGTGRTVATFLNALKYDTDDEVEFYIERLW